MTKIEFEKWAIGKSKREILAVIPADTKVNYFETRKGIPVVMTLTDGEWGLYSTLRFDKGTRRVY